MMKKEVVENCELYNADCFDVLKILPEKSVDLVVTDPPYWHKKSPGKPYCERKQCQTKSKFSNSELYSYDGDMIKTMSDFTDKEMYALCDELKRVMKIMNAYIFCSETQVPYYAMWAERNNLMFSILVWEKPLSIINKNRFSQNTEYIVRIYDYGTALNKLENNEIYNKVKKIKPISGARKIHPVEKPIEIMEQFVLLSSKEDDVVLDCFMGSGSCGLACMYNKRKFIGIEKNEKFYAEAKNRIEDEKIQNLFL